MEQELRILQRKLAEVDLQTQPQPMGRVQISKILLLKLRGLKLKMYKEQGHLRPHLHVDYGREHHVASYAVDEPQRLEGALDTKYDRQIVEWIAENQGALSRAWVSCSPEVIQVSLSENSLAMCNHRSTY